MNENAEKIKQNITMTDVLNRYGLRLNRHKAMCCPFHREKTASFKLYSNDKKYHCFGCGADGDVISFVMNYFGLSYGQAISRLAYDFGIGIAGQKIPTVRDRLMMHKQRQKIEQERDKRHREYDRLFDAYIDATDELIRLQINSERYAPKTPSEPLHELYIEAMRNMPIQKYKCDMAQLELEEYEERSTEDDATTYTSAGLHQGRLSQRAGAV